MLGSLTRWLRIIGQPTEYYKDVKDDELIKSAVAKNAILLTRDKKLFQKAGNYCQTILVKENETRKQFAEAINALKISVPKRLPAKICTKCGGLLKKMTKTKAKPLVWPRVYASQKQFWQCTECKQVYWQGSHAEGILKALRVLQ